MCLSLCLDDECLRAIHTGRVDSDSMTEIESHLQSCPSCSDRLNALWNHAEHGKPVEFLSVAGLLMGELEESGWQKDRTPLIADFGAVRGVLERLLSGLHIDKVGWEPLGESASDYPQFHPGRTALVSFGEDYPTGIVGELHPRIVQQLELRHRVYLFEVALEALQGAATVEERYQSASRFPTAQRDLAPRVATSITYSDVVRAISSANAPNLVDFRLTDVFQGNPLPEGVKSLTLSFTFRSGQGTLTDGEINSAMEQLRQALIEHIGATFVA